MKIARMLLLLLALGSGHAVAYIIDYSGTMRMSKDDGSYANPTLPETLHIPFEVAADTNSLTFLTMSIWLNGEKLTDYIEPGSNDEAGEQWAYDHTLNHWAAGPGFQWFFSQGDAHYELDWAYIEILAGPDSNPIEEFPNFVEGPWFFRIDEGATYTQYTGSTSEPIIGIPRQVPEPATLSLLLLGLAAIGIRRRFH